MHTGALVLYVSPWQHALRYEAVKLQKVCVDSKLQWSQVGNVWHNAGAQPVLHAIATKWRWVRGLMRSCNPRCPAQNAGPWEDNNVI